MTTLATAVDETIRNLEIIRDKQGQPADDILAALDTLYERQLDLIAAAISQRTGEYVTATQAMKEAAKKTQEAIDDLSRLEKSIDTIAKAIAKITELLVTVA